MENFSRTDKRQLNKIFIFVLLMATPKWCRCTSSNSSSFNNVGCKDSERKALLNFRHSLSIFGTHVTSTWEGDDCCKWQRVSCDPTIGHVLKLQFSGRYIYNEDEDNYYMISFIKTENLESSLQYLKELKHLEHLDLSSNDFSESHMPKALGSMQQLRYLNLSQTRFSKGIPDELGNLTHLQSLDLNYAGSLTFNHLYWVSSLRELEYLDMSGSNLSPADDWVKSLIGPLPSLRELRLAECELTTYNNAIPNSSFLSLPIQHLDLSQNQLWGDIPRFIQNLTHLEYLDLSSNYLGPNIPLWFGKLQSLVHLGLSYNKFTSVDVQNIWGLVHNLCSLRFLSLLGNNLQGNVLEPMENSSTICTRYDLEVLDLSSNININGAIPTWLGEKFQSLEVLDLSTNQLTGEIPASLGNSLVLKELNLASNKLSGEIPASLGNSLVLKELNLASNKLSQISPFFKFPSTLEHLVLAENNLTGQIPKSLGNLSKLQSIFMSSNPLLNGTVLSKTHFTNLSNLSVLDLSDTFLTLKFPEDWVPPFQLGALMVGTCKFNGNFPQWLQTQKHLNTLNFSNAGISGAIPKWFHTMQHLQEVYLSHNQISGSPVFPINFAIVEFSNNALSGPLFSINSSLQINITYLNAYSVDISSNSISGLLPEYLDRQMPSLQQLILSDNQIYGPIPTSLCQLESLVSLVLDKNRLSGAIPSCFKHLTYVSLASNKLRGNIPCFGLGELSNLLLNDNKLSGQLPRCLENSTGLEVLDVGGNELSGKMPAWLNNDIFPSLTVLRLSGNKFNGSIPHQLCSLSSLQLLDLSHNHLSGTIPSCFSNLTVMSSPQPRYSLLPYDPEVKEVFQGIEHAYTTTLGYFVNIDLSCNELVGNIPDGITNLSSLLNLNLSNNHLTGVIPQNIGAMKSLIALDLSKNRLEGTIPTSMAELNELSYLNLSYNNFSGQMPTGNQLQTLDNPSFYVGNPFLCGDFLPRECKTTSGGVPKDSENKGAEKDEEEDNKHETMWFYLVMMSGVATGFWGVVGSLLLKRRWRHALFGRVEDAYDWLYVAIVVKMARLMKKWECSSVSANLAKFEDDFVEMQSAICERKSS